MEKIHIRNLFRVHLRLNGSLGVPAIRTGPFGVEFENEIKLDQRFGLVIRLVCTDSFGNIKYEPAECFTWAKRSPVIYQQDETKKEIIGIFIRLKINQGVIDFRKEKYRLCQIIVESFENGVATKTGTSTIWELFPKKRRLQIEGDGNEVVIPVHWVGEDGYVTDDRRELSYEPKWPQEVQNFSRPSLAPAGAEVHWPATRTRQRSESPRMDSPINSHETSRSLDYHSLGHQSSPEWDSTAPQAWEEDNTSHSTSNDNYMVLYNGNAEVVGNFRALNFYKASDINIKEDIRLLEFDRDCRASLLQINGVEYKFKPGVSHTTNKRFIGYIAQQIERVVPEAVQLIDGILHVDYESLIPFLSESVKQNYNDVQRVSSEVSQIKSVIDDLYERFSTSTKSQIHVKHISVTQKSSVGWIIGAILMIATFVALGVGFVYLPKQSAPPLQDNPTTNLVPANYERNVLLELYNHLRPGDVAPLWNFTEPHCTWHGISCNSTTGNVIGIYLVVISSVSDAPQLPAGIGNLTELQSLTLFGNFLTGTIPDSLRNLKNLVYLDLSVNNDLSGPLPDLSDLLQLKEINLALTRVQIQLDELMLLPALQILIIETRLKSSLPQKISGSLTEIRLSNSDLHGTIPESWTSSNLTTILLDGNRLTGSVPCFGEKVTVVDLSGNQLSGEFCGDSLASVTYLKIDNNQLSGTFDLPNTNISAIGTLFISNNQFTSLAPSSNDSMLAPVDCDAANNPFLCPIPAWSEKCHATCS